MKQEEYFDMFASSMLRFRNGGRKLSLISNVVCELPHMATFTDFRSQSSDSTVRF